MRTRTSILFISSLTVLFFVAGALLSRTGKGEQRYEPRAEKLLQQVGAPSGYKGALEYYSKIREGMNPETVERTRNAVENFDGPKAGSLHLDWSSEGPVNQGGRTRAILIMRDDSSKLIAGGVSGGLWKSNDNGKNWKRLSGFDKKGVVVSSIAQLGNGDIYVGTGSVHETPNGTGGSGFVGRGLYRSTDGGKSFDLVPGTEPDSNSLGDGWAFINDLAPDPTNDDALLIARSSGGSGGGLTRYEAGSGLTNLSGVSGAHAIDVSRDGKQFLVSTVGGNVLISDDGGNSFQDLSSGPQSPLPSPGGRTEVAVSKDNKDYMYAVFTQSNGSLHGVYMSKDGGDNWAEIAGAGSGSFQPMYNGLTYQGNYDLAISVKPEDPGTIVLGGITLWKWKNQPTSFNSFAGQWSQLATNSSQASVPFYVHSDIHTFNWGSTDELYIGTDGGVFYSDDGLQTFLPSSLGYKTTQFYSVEFSPNDKVLGGSQDNGTLFLDRENKWSHASQVRGGDGFDCEISQMDPSVLFATTYGSFNLGLSHYVQRSENGGDQISNFLSSQDFNTPIEGFNSNIRLFEDRNDTLSKDSVEFINNSSGPLYKGDTIEYESQTLFKKVKGTVPVDTLEEDDTIMVQDPVQSLFAFTGLNSSNNPLVYVTRDALRLAKSSVSAHPVVSLPSRSSVFSYAFSPDGNYLYVGLRNGEVHRVSGLDSAYNKSQFQNEVSSKVVLNTLSTPVTGIDVDANDPDHVVVSYGGYGNSDKVWQTSNATAGSPNFNSVWNSSVTNLSKGLAEMPVYDVIIERDDPNVLLAGTEYGIFASDDGGNTWVHQDQDPLGHIPVFDIEQQELGWDEGAKNPGHIYLGTHGRGFFKTDEFKSIKPAEKGDGKERAYASFDLHPNPASEHTFLSLPEDRKKGVRVIVHDLQGKTVRSLNAERLEGSDGERRMDVSELKQGIYIVRVRGEGFDRTAKLVVSR